MKIVIDCNVIIAAGLTNGTSRKVVNTVLSYHQNFISDDIVREYRNVIIRPKFKNYFSHLIQIVENICICSKWVQDTPSISTYSLPDQTDKIYLDLAIEVGAEYLITGNGKDFPEKKYDTTNIISPTEFSLKFST